MSVSLRTTVLNALDSVKTALKNPFGLEFKIRDHEIFVSVGSVLNCPGVTTWKEWSNSKSCPRSSRPDFCRLCGEKNPNDIAVATGHVFRGMVEIFGSIERELLILDILFTVGNFVYKFFNPSVLTQVPTNPQQQFLHSIECLFCSLGFSAMSPKQDNFYKSAIVKINRFVTSQYLCYTDDEQSD